MMSERMFYMKKIVTSLFYYFISAMGISLTIKASIGVSSFNSLNVAISNLTGIQVGTITSLINALFLIGCLAVDANRNVRKYILMFTATVSFGYTINLFCYTFFHHLVFSSYLARVAIFLLGVFIAGFGTGQVLRINILTFPIETFCQLLANKTEWSFSSYRYSVDIICVILSLFISICFNLPVVVREGTIISLFLLSGIISFSRKLKKFE